MQDSRWQVEGNKGVAVSAEQHATIDADRSADGVRVSIGSRGKPLVQMHGVAFSGSTGGPSSPCVEIYPRGNDLVATYQQSEVPKFRHQIYWRLLDCSDLLAHFACELIVSVQTDLLDSQPQIMAGSRFLGSRVAVCGPDDDRFQQIDLANQPQIAMAVAAAPQICLWRLADTTHSFAEIAAPNDGALRGASVTGEGGVASDWQLFAGRLEKGVILRSRLWGIVLPRSGDEELALAWRKKLLQSPLPLTA